MESGSGNLRVDRALSTALDEALSVPTNASAAGNKPGKEAIIGVEFSVDEDALCLRVGGEIDVKTAHAFALSLEDVLSNVRDAAVLDLTDIGFVGTTGLGALVDFSRQLKSRDAAWVLIGSRAVLRPLRAIGADFPMCDSAQEAWALIRSPGNARYGG